LTRHMTKDTSPQRRQMRELIAQSAARLIAEDGIQDYAAAKRKAARQIGVPDTHSLPSNTEVEVALRAYQELYQKDEQPARLKCLRQEALATMHLLERFNPHLTGSVLSGTATRHSDINLQLFTDNVKEIELFLINRGMPYETGEKRFRHNDEFFPVPTFTLQGETAEIRLAVFGADDLRKNAAAGKTLERAKIRQVEALLAIA
jgi:predicted nucleotidyltransferase